jgi:hypothetical protein
MQTHSTVHARSHRAASTIGGRVAPGFEEVRTVATFSVRATAKRLHGVLHMLFMHARSLSASGLVCPCWSVHE